MSFEMGSAMGSAMGSEMGSAMGSEMGSVMILNPNEEYEDFSSEAIMRYRDYYISYQKKFEEYPTTLFLMNYCDHFSKIFITKCDSRITLFNLYNKLITYCGNQITANNKFNKFPNGETYFPPLPPLWRYEAGDVCCSEHSIVYKTTKYPKDQSNYRITIKLGFLNQVDLYSGCSKCIDDLKFQVAEARKDYIKNVSLQLLLTFGRLRHQISPIVKDVGEYID
jgi:hypothetical protein